MNKRVDTYLAASIEVSNAGQAAELFFAGTNVQSLVVAFSHPFDELSWWAASQTGGA